MKILAIIPARGGSKGVPGKNIKLIDGKPLISYTIEAALASNKLDQIWVSSDAENILNVANAYSRVILHLRSKELASDESPITETIMNIIQLSGLSFDAIMLLQPTSPIRTGKQIDEAIQIFESNKEINSLISVVAMNDVHPARMYWKDNDKLISILSEYESTRRQEIPNAYYRNGSIYIVKTKSFLETKSMMVKPSIGYEMPVSQLLNIDEPRDIIIAESLIKAWKKGGL